jgi:hypothetical protein
MRLVKLDASLNDSLPPLLAIHLVVAADVHEDDGRLGLDVDDAHVAGHPERPLTGQGAGQGTEQWRHRVVGPFGAEQVERAVLSDETRAAGSRRAPWPPGGALRR